MSEEDRRRQLKESEAERNKIRQRETAKAAGEYSHPDDPASLQAKIANLTGERDDLIGRLDLSEAKVESLTMGRDSFESKLNELRHTVASLHTSDQTQVKVLRSAIHAGIRYLNGLTEWKSNEALVHRKLRNALAEQSGMLLNHTGDSTDD